jgi:hypothetical protein
LFSKVLKAFWPLLWAGIRTMEDWDADCVDVKSLTTSATTSQQLVPVTLNSEEQVNKDHEQLSAAFIDESLERMNSLTLDQPKLEEVETQHSSNNQKYLLVTDSKNKVFVSNISFKVRSTVISMN